MDAPDRPNGAIWTVTFRETSETAPSSFAMGAHDLHIPGIDSPSGWTDPLCMTDGPIFWARLMTSEAARIRRYRRSATIVLFELAGLGRLSRMWGHDVAAQCLVRAAATLTSQVRSSDQSARIMTARFGAYLPETNEIDAINFVERTRAAITAGLGPSSETVTAAFGWASPTDGELEAAVLIAEERLAREIAAAVRPHPSGPPPG